MGLPLQDRAGGGPRQAVMPRPSPKAAGPRAWRRTKPPPTTSPSSCTVTSRVSDATYARALELFGEQGIIDLIGINGYYSFLAMMMNVAAHARSIPTTCRRCERFPELMPWPTPRANRIAGWRRCSRRRPARDRRRWRNGTRPIAATSA